MLAQAGHAAGQGGGADRLRVDVQVERGPYFAGQAFELDVGVIAAGERPKIEPPRIPDARVWTIGNQLRPITTSGIGSMISQENLFVVRFRVLPTRAGKLTIPAIRAELKGRSGRSKPKSLAIEGVPLQGRPAEFLGGVGRFEVEAEAAPDVVRVGQELDFRIKVKGPAAWGMTARPELSRFATLDLGLRIEPKPDEASDEPPVRTFVYRLRPTRSGQAVLPPVAIAAFDPQLHQYITHVTAGVSIRAVAVPSFDPATIEYEPPTSDLDRFTLFVRWGLPLLAGSAIAVYIVVRRRRMRLGARAMAFGPERARRFARQQARWLASVKIEPRGHAGESTPSEAESDFVTQNGRETPSTAMWPWKGSLRSARTIVHGDRPEVVAAVARRVVSLLRNYLFEGTGQMLGVLTPGEARDGIAALTGSDRLAAVAWALTTRCDQVLYGDRTIADPAEELGALIGQARRLFEALGRTKKTAEPANDD